MVKQILGKFIGVLPVVFCLSLTLSVVSGCGKAKSKGAPPDLQRSLSMVSLAVRKLADEGNYPKSLDAIQETVDGVASEFKLSPGALNAMHFFFGEPVQSDSQNLPKVIAFQKEANADGTRLVLHEMGVTTMNAEEFDASGLQAKAGN